MFTRPLLLAEYTLHSRRQFFALDILLQQEVIGHVETTYAFNVHDHRALLTAAYTIAVRRMEMTTSEKPPFCAEDVPEIAQAHIIAHPAIVPDDHPRYHLALMTGLCCGLPELISDFRGGSPYEELTKTLAALHRMVRGWIHDPIAFFADASNYDAAIRLRYETKERYRMELLRRYRRLGEMYGDSALLRQHLFGPTDAIVLDRAGDDAAMTERLLAEEQDDFKRVQLRVTERGVNPAHVIDTVTAKEAARVFDR